MELSVIGAERGFNGRRGSFTVIYEGRELKVPMFKFQEGQTRPEKIACIIKNRKLLQDPLTIVERFYAQGQSYLFKVKTVRRSMKFYELTDERVNEEELKLSLPYFDSNSDLQTGQLIRCQVKGFDNDKPLLKLVDDNPSRIEFVDRTAVFGTSPALQQWLDTIFDKDIMATTAQAYGQQDGRWLCHLSQQMEKIICTLLVSKVDGKEHLLQGICQGWINKVERSPMMNNLSQWERGEFSASLNHSIEVCEDFIDALAITTPDRTAKIDELIATLHPQYCQYRLERRLRFLACILSLDTRLLLEKIDRLLEHIGLLGQEICSSDSTHLPITVLLKICTHATTDALLGLMAVSSNDFKNIKRGMLALCYLIKVKHRRHDTEMGAYAAKLFLLASIYIAEPDTKQELLQSAYRATFATQDVIPQFSWTDLPNIVKSEIYQFCKHIVPAGGKLRLGNEVSGCELTPADITIKPYNYQADIEDWPMTQWLKLHVSYNKSLLRLRQEDSFLAVRNAWNDVMNTVATPVQKIVNRSRELHDGDEAIDIYITGIIDSRTLACRAVDYDATGIVMMKDFFFYDKPQLHPANFIGSDGSPLIFPADVSLKNGSFTFNPINYRNQLARNVVSEGDLLTCLIIIDKNMGKYTAISCNGMFVNVNVNGQNYKRGDYVVTMVDYTGRGSGYIDATAIRPAEEAEKFNNDSCYPNFIKLFNDAYYGEEFTINKCRDEESSDGNSGAAPAPRRVSKGQAAALMHILCKQQLLADDARQRYGLLAVAKMLASITGNARAEELLAVRMRFAELLYSFSINSKLAEHDIEKFTALTVGVPPMPEITEMQSVAIVLGKYGRRTQHAELDKELTQHMETAASPLVKELARLVLLGNMLANFHNEVLHDKVLDEIGNTLNITIQKPKKLSLGRESDTQEFKTSLVFPPNNRGNENLEQQSDNIIRAISGLMNNKGGTLYIGVNDDGNVVGLYDDLAYFSDRHTYNEAKSRDNFKNYFSFILTDRLGAEVAAKFHYDFDQAEEYTIFRIDVPEHHSASNPWIRVGTTVQRR